MTAPRPQMSRERQRFIDDLLAYMTLEEKLGQLDIAHAADDPALESAIAAGRIGGVVDAVTPQRLQTLATEHSRLGIPLLIAAKSTGQSMSPWALAASWDEDLARNLGDASSERTAESGADCMLGPEVALASESAVHSTALLATSQSHLAGRLAEAFAEGVAHVSLTAGARTIAIPEISGPPAAALRCGFELAHRGSVDALDCSAIDHNVALNAGFSGLMPAECRRIIAILADHFETTSARSPLEAAEKALAEGLVGEHEIDRAVRDVLAVKHSLGLFRRGSGAPTESPLPIEQISDADAARRAMVLLRNEAGLLPLSPVSDRVLLVGAAEGVGGACANALSRAGIGYTVAPGLALRGIGDPATDPIVGDQFAQSLTRDAAQRADFVLVVLEDRHFLPRGDGPWRRPGRAMLMLLDALATARSRLVALIATDEPVDLAEADRHFSAVLHCWRPRAGFDEALADILSGRESPQGRFPVAAGRFAFGQGIGYGECIFSELAVSVEADRLVAAVQVLNSGSFAARETVQAYTRGKDGDPRLVGFSHVTLAPGESATVAIELDLAALGEVGADGRIELSPGWCEILVGKNVARLLSARVELTPALIRSMRGQTHGGLRLAAS